EGAKLTIEGDDRNSVFVLFSDLREYIKSEVTTTRSAEPLIASKHLTVIGMMLIFLVMLGAMMFSQSRPNLQRQVALDTQDILAKLNYLIHAKDEEVKSLYWL